MAKAKMRTFLVSYKLADGDASEQERVKAQDEACALGCVLDEYDDDQRFDWIHIADAKAKAPKAADVPDAITALPIEIQRAYQAALGVG